MNVPEKIVKKSRKGQRQTKKPVIVEITDFFVARKEGFEPSRRFYPAYSLSRGAPSASWVLPQVK